MAQGFLIGKDKREEGCRNEYYKWESNWKFSIFARPIPKALPAVDDLLFKLFEGELSELQRIKWFIRWVYLGQQRHRYIMRT